jgi:hypothetical protein
LGTAEQKISETIYDGSLHDRSWGNLPVVILVGDDYQLPGIEEGALDCLISHKGGKMTVNGRQTLKECANFVMSLKVSKRIKDKNTKDRKLMQKLRVAQQLKDTEVNRMLNLHLNKIKQKHGAKYVEEIKNKAIFLFYRNAPRTQKNLEMIVTKSSNDNPVAICKTESKGSHYGRAITSHFGKNSEIPKTALLCHGAKVSLENKNFCPQWGLHNGATGTVDEIVFAQGETPNEGHLPMYVVVNFPQYTGPTWDMDNPKVSGRMKKPEFVALN